MPDGLHAVWQACLHVPICVGRRHTVRILLAVLQRAQADRAVPVGLQAAFLRDGLGRDAFLGGHGHADHAKEYLPLHQRPDRLSGQDVARLREATCGALAGGRLGFASTTPVVEDHTPVGQLAQEKLTICEEADARIPHGLRQAQRLHGGHARAEGNARRQLPWARPMLIGAHLRRARRAWDRRIVTVPDVAARALPAEGRALRRKSGPGDRHSRRGRGRDG
eukprot:scaffold5359_cov265-Pinguiococcus_pyrenoidosus.AAC.4